MFEALPGSAAGHRFGRAPNSSAMSDGEEEPSSAVSSAGFGENPAGSTALIPILSTSAYGETDVSNNILFISAKKKKNDCCVVNELYRQYFG